MTGLNLNNRMFITILLITIGACKLINSQAQSNMVRDKDGNTYTWKIMSDNKQWLTKNLNTNVEESYCQENNPMHCSQYGRLYTFLAAQKACSMLGDGWRLPTNEEWEKMAAQYGGVRDKSNDGGKAAYQAMLVGGNSGFNAVLGGNRELDDKGYARFNAHGFYWTSSETGNNTAWLYNFGKGGKILNRHEDGNKQEAISVRCIRY